MIDDKASLLSPLRPQRNRAGEVAERIAAEIRSGRLSVGARLPTEQELTEAMGVSRTVVREAIAALRTEGLVVSRQGSGTYVSAIAAQAQFRIDPETMAAIDDVIGVMELRLAVEVEAAALAAERATARQRSQIDDTLRRFKVAIKAGEVAATEDFAFHQAVASATGNPRFADLLTFLGRHVIPRQSIRSEIGAPEEMRAYLTGIAHEHDSVAAAIRTRDAARAGAAMRHHLARGLARYRTLAERLQEAAPRSGEAPRQEKSPPR